MGRRGVLSAFFLLTALVLQAQADRKSMITYDNADSIAALYAGESLGNLPLLTRKLTKDLNTDEERFRSIYKWICDNIAYDHSMYLTNKRKRAKARSVDELKGWNGGFSHSVLKTLRTKKRTVCTGYAYLLREMAALAGITSMVIDGYGRNAASNIGGSGVPDHSWNAVKLGNKWYLCDPTWSTGYYDANTAQFVRSFNDVYFLAEPASFITNHFPLDTAWILMNSKPTLQQFLNAPLFYAAAYPFSIKSLSPGTFTFVAAKDEPILFSFAAHAGKPIRKAEIFGARTDSPDKSYLNLIADDRGLYQLEYRLHTKGEHVLHVLLENHCVFTYRVTVR